MSTTTTKKPIQIRQGDVLLKYVDSLPSKLKPVLRQRGRLVLATGASRHDHYVDDTGSEIHETADGTRYVTIKGELLKGEWPVVSKSPLHVLVEHPKLGRIAFRPEDAVTAKRNKVAVVNGHFALLRHDSNPTEHETIALPRGLAEQFDQSEFNHDEVRRVTD